MLWLKEATKTCSSVGAVLDPSGRYVADETVEEYGVVSGDDSSGDSEMDFGHLLREVEMDGRLRIRFVLKE